ncbi:MULTISPECIES: hypothetical protein [unclassified Sphingomonas]|uniref:hypothetical protein n=1 Tax=unclassified Sphingomonas TaxID=196159 RepID=UPI0006FFF9A9|nr:MULTISPECIES: hypothetical protein [unclassified Sphingomonas]KQM61472.1 hypothetical protein ASE65_08050 [Sphingomonas sp. Leaf16]KQN12567.1 hypothetical protein ASE81_09060 [Sphingomonas sp. Leaf29]KQN19047.1 hypothetical protein ASE83_08985 [Sphingomonas sp. Leaf32]
MIERFTVALLAFALSASAGCSAEPRQSTAEPQRTMQDVRSGHIAANLPSDAEFMVLLRRDVKAYLGTNQLLAKRVAIELLRRGPTQSGVSYPKYYAWVRAEDDTGNRVEGAMRIVAIEGTRFEVSDFTPAAMVRSDPASLASIYPALLIPAIRQHAGVE